MKTAIKSILAFAMLIVGVSTASAQNLKLGYINTAEVIDIMPEKEEAATAFEAYSKEWGEQFNALNSEFSTKVQDYQKKLPNMSPAMAQQAEKDLNALRQRIQEFDQVAQEDLQRKQQELMQPIITKLQDAIAAVGKENGFTYVFDLSQGGILYFNETTANNIMPMVKTKLGL